MVQMLIDFHIHTYHSYDSLMKPARILRLAKMRGLDAIVICDHNTLKGAIETQALNNDSGLIVIPGAEIATDAGDITGIFIKNEIKSRKFSEVVREIKDQGGHVILNHPYKGHDLSLIDFSMIDFIEGWNSRLDLNTNSMAVDLARKHNIPVVGGSDAHVYPEIGLCCTEVSDLESLTPLKTVFRPSKPVYVTGSQLIKSVKSKSPSLFFRTLIIYLKTLLNIKPGKAIFFEKRKQHPG